VLLAPEVAELKLTGSFPIDQPQKLLEALPRILPVRLSERQGRVELLAR
jgi:transmembrane sensor